jgi:hypothetical protein
MDLSQMVSHPPIINELTVLSFQVFMLDEVQRTRQFPTDLNEEITK